MSECAVPPQTTAPKGQNDAFHASWQHNQPKYFTSLSTPNRKIFIELICLLNYPSFACGEWPMQGYTPC